MKTNKTFIALLLCLLGYISADYLALRLHVLSRDQAIFGLHFLWLLVAVIVLWCCAYRKVLLLLVCASIALGASAQTNSFRLLSTQDIEPKFTACEFAIGGVVIAVGGFMIYKICTSPFWTNIPPPPPATNPPPNPRPGTNGCTALSLPAQTVTLPPFVVDENALRFAFVPMASVSLTSTPILDWWGPQPIPWDRYYWGRYPWESSGDLITWKPCELRSWANSNGCLALLLDGDGQSLVVTYTPTGIEPMERWTVPAITNVTVTAPQKFFRFAL